jgi:hypothetical protein
MTERSMSEDRETTNDQIARTAPEDGAVSNRDGSAKQAVDAYRAERVSEPSPVPTKPEHRRPPPLTTLTEIPGYPLGPCRPEVETPTYGSREAAIDASRKMKRRANGTAIFDPIGPPELRKRDTMSGATDTRGITSKHR